MFIKYNYLLYLWLFSPSFCFFSPSFGLFYPSFGLFYPSLWLFYHSSGCFTILRVVLPIPWVVLPIPWIVYQICNSLIMLAFLFFIFRKMKMLLKKLWETVSFNLAVPCPVGHVEDIKSFLKVRYLSGNSDS